MKKIVYVCGGDGLSSECEILYNGSMIIVSSCYDDDLIGIDMASMIEMTGDMVDEFIKSGLSRDDTKSALIDVMNAARTYLDMIKKVGVVS